MSSPPESNGSTQYHHGAECGQKGASTYHLEVGSEKRLLLTNTEIRPNTDNIQTPHGKHSLGGLFRLSLFPFLAFGIIIFSLLSVDTETGYETPFLASHSVKEVALASSSSSSSAPASTLTLEVFQVYQPVSTPSGVTDEAVSSASDGSENTTTIGQTTAETSCEVLLMDHSFGWSYGIPFVGNYTPPKCQFNRVTMNFTVTSRGRQFDRLAIMYFNDTEVWRTSTAEPTTNGIRWEYIKDMTEYMYFWDSPQKLIFDIGNLIDSTYTGFFNTTLTATFFNSKDTLEPASLIIPISARRGEESAASMFTLPSDNATNTVNFPRNVNRAVFSVSACGQSTEEFWWSNVLQSDINTFLPYDGALYGYSPFREVQVLIDGQLAGVQWPFPVIFTGGVVPGLWRPIVGIDAFDLREHEIDITPWLPFLCDGNEHTFEIRVAGILDDGNHSGTITESVGSSWYVTGKIFIWLDSNSNSITTGRAPTILLPAPVISLSHSYTQDPTGANETLEYTTNVQRTLSISSLITTQSGTKLSTWTQSLQTTNYGLYTAYGAIQQTNQSTIGSDQSTGGVYYKSTYSYPLYANTSYLVQPSGNFTIDATVIRGLSLSVYGTPVFSTGLQTFPSPSRLGLENFQGTTSHTTQNGTAHYFASPSAGISSGFGGTSQEFVFSGLGDAETELYYRNVDAVNSSVVRDYESLVGDVSDSFTGRGGEEESWEGIVSVKGTLGRGPGRVKDVLIQVGG